MYNLYRDRNQPVDYNFENFSIFFLWGECLQREEFCLA